MKVVLPLLSMLLALASSLTYTASSSPHQPGIAPATPPSFNHIVIIAMENQHYDSVIGNHNAPFINSITPIATTLNPYHSYGQGISGCSAGCYQAFTAGQVIASDGWCPPASSPCSNANNIANQIGPGNWAAFCEDGCRRGADHFPWIGYQNTWNSCVTSFTTCTGSSAGRGFGTNPPGNIYNSVSSNPSTWSGISATGNTAFINYLNSSSPAPYIWFTPDDSHNMHDNGVSSGDQYLQSLLVGTGTLTSPASGSVLATDLFEKPGTFLYIWWDEYDPSPNLEYGSMIKQGYTSTAGYNEYNSLHTIEANFELPFITTIVASDAAMSDIFTTPPTLSTSFNYTPTTPLPNQVISFTASPNGGTGPYTNIFNFGDGSARAKGTTVTHSYISSGTFNVKLVTTDRFGSNSTSSKLVTIVGITSAGNGGGGGTPPRPN